MTFLLPQERLINEKQLDVFGMKLPTGFQLIGQVVCTFVSSVLPCESFNYYHTSAKSTPRNDSYLGQLLK